MRLISDSDILSGQIDLIIIFIIIQGYRIETPSVSHGRTQTFGGSAKFSSKQKLSPDKYQGLNEQYQFNGFGTEGKTLFALLKIT